MTAAKQANKKARKPAGRLDASAWTDAGLDLLACGGVDAVTIDELARVLGVTKGSFYWHFENRAELLHSMLATWRRSATLAVIARLESEGSPAQRLRRLIELPMSGSGTPRGQSLELAVRLWAKSDRHAAAAIEEVDHHRLMYVASLLRAIGLAEGKAGARAYLIYAFILAEAFIPARSTEGVVSADDLARLVEDLVGRRPLP